MLVWTGACQPSLGILRKDCKVENVRRGNPLPGHRNFTPCGTISPSRPSIASGLLGECLGACVMGEGCLGSWQEPVGHMRLAAIAQSGSPGGLVGSSLFLWGPFSLWAMGLLAGNFSPQLLLWHAWKEGRRAPYLPKDWSRERVEEDGCHYLLCSKERAVCLGARHALRCSRGLHCQVSVVTARPPASVSPEGERGW